MPERSFALRRLALDDMDAAARIHRAAFDDRLPWLKGLHTPAEDRAYFRHHVFAECAVWGIADQADLIGFIAFRKDWIDQLYVAPARQGEGVGAALLRHAQTAETRLHLWTFQRNAPARRFYERRGFVAIEETDGARNEEREPDILYRWTR